MFHERPMGSNERRSGEAWLSEGLAAAARVRRDALLELGESVAARSDVAVIAGPDPQSLLVELESAVGSFCLTEVVVTTCEATVDAHLGWGCALGWDAEGALAAALGDAAGGEAAASLAVAALEEEARTAIEERRMLAVTRVGDA
jgi:alpha-D-ribose 1-methylphosphonate 5-triphosphate synthase subunit PhnG